MIFRNCCKERDRNQKDGIFTDTRRVHETGRFYDADLEELRQSFDGLWDVAQKILTSLAKIQ